MVVYCAADLLWATRIKATAEAISIPCRPVRNPDMLRARLSDSDVRGLIVDLETGDAGLTLIRALREQGQIPGEQGPANAGGMASAAAGGLDPDRKVQILAFGPHVAVDLFREAERAGADRVLARGAFDRHLPEILQRLEAGEV